MRLMLFAALCLFAEPAIAQVTAKPPAVANTQVSPKIGPSQIAKPNLSPGVTQPAMDAKALADRLASLNLQKKAKEAEMAALQAQIDALKAEKDSKGELGVEVSTRLQLYQNRYSAAAAVLSDIMKKIADTQSAITANLK